MSDRLRYTEDVNKLPPATEFLRAAFAETDIVKGIICHGMWLVAPMPELVRGRQVVAHNNLHGDVMNMGAIYTDQDVVVDGDLVTGRTGGHCHLFAREIIDLIDAKERRDGSREVGQGFVASHGLPSFRSSSAATRSPRSASTRKHFGFQRARVVPLGGGDQIVFLKSGTLYLELFQATQENPVSAAAGTGPEYPGWRHLAFKVDDIDAKLAEMGADARSRRPDELRRFHPGLADGVGRRSRRQHRRDQPGLRGRGQPRRPNPTAAHGRAGDADKCAEK